MALPATQADGRWADVTQVAEPQGVMKSCTAATYMTLKYDSVIWMYT
jgi:hypothetical protein